MTAGYETRVGYVDVKSSSGVYFYVGRNSPYSTTESVIPYDVASLNIGGAMDLASGVFTAPVSGRYQFNFVAQADVDSGTAVILRWNGGQIARGYGRLLFNTLAMTATVSLQKNDRIDTYLDRGVVYDCIDCYNTQFTGILLEEDLVLS